MSEKLWGQYGGRKLTGIGFALTGMRPLASTSIWCNCEWLTNMCFGLTEIRPCVSGSRNPFIRSGRGFDDKGELFGVISARDIVVYLAEHFPMEIYNRPPTRDQEQIFDSREGG